MNNISRELGKYYMLLICILLANFTIINGKWKRYFFCTYFILDFVDFGFGFLFGSRPSVLKEPPVF